MKTVFTSLFLFLLSSSFVFSQLNWRGNLSGGNQQVSIPSKNSTDASVSLSQFGVADGGTSWTNVSPIMTNEPFTSVSFTDHLNGAAVGAEKQIILTTDGGFHWKTGYTTIFGQAIKICLINTRRWVMIYENGIIQTTKDSGRSWITTAVHVMLYNLAFIDSMNGVVVGDSLFKTTDGGEIWSGRNRDGQFNKLNAVKFPTPQIGYAVGNNSAILKTTDGGETWRSIGTMYESYNACAFTDADNGTIVGTTILHTTDGGKTWTRQDSSAASPSAWLGISLPDKKSGTIVGVGGIILHTTDGGNNWVQVPPFRNSNLWDVCFTDVNNGTIVGGSGTVLHTTNGGVSFINDAPVSSRPADFELMQNYPNPFNPSTTISYIIPKEGHVVLKVYTILGRETATLVNENQSVGNHSVSFNAGNIPSGIYFYTIHAGEFTATKKMIVMK